LREDEPVGAPSDRVAKPTIAKRIAVVLILVSLVFVRYFDFIDCFPEFTPFIYYRSSNLSNNVNFLSELQLKGLASNFL